MGRAGVVGVGDPDAVGVIVGPVVGSSEEHPAATPSAARDATRMNVRRSSEPGDTREV